MLHMATQLKQSRMQALPQNLWASEWPRSSQPGSQRALMTSPSRAPIASGVIMSNKTPPFLLFEPRLLKEQDMKSQWVRGALLIRHWKQSSGLTRQPFKMYLSEWSMCNFPGQTPEPKSTRKRWSIKLNAVLQLGTWQTFKSSARFKQQSPKSQNFELPSGSASSI